MIPRIYIECGRMLDGNEEGVTIRDDGTRSSLTDAHPGRARKLMALKVYCEDSIVAEIDRDTNTLLAVRDDFRPLWDEFRRDGIDQIGPGHLSEADRKAGVICAAAVYQSFELGAFLERLKQLGFTCKDGKNRYEL